MVDMDVLYGGGGLPYPFNTEPDENTEEEAHVNNKAVEDKTQAPNDTKVTEEYEPLAAADSSLPLTMKKG